MRALVVAAVGMLCSLASLTAMEVDANASGCQRSGHGGSRGIIMGGHCDRDRRGHGGAGGVPTPEPPTRIRECANPQATPPLQACVAPPACPDGVAWEYQRWDGAVWVPVGAVFCNHAQPPPPRRRVPTVAEIRDRAVRLLPKVAIGSAPEGAGLAQTETILWATTGADRALPDVSLLGQTVHLRIHFDHASWDYGDGTTGTSTDPGTAYDDEHDPCTTAQCSDYAGHTYTTTGRVTVRLTVTWHAQYQLDGADWQDIPEPITGPGSTQALTIREARGVIVH